LGAISGALSRYYLTLFCSQVFGLSWIGTFAINLSGAFGMGFFMKLVSEQVIISADLRFLIAVGCLGSYTTFSTYELETVMLLDNHWQLGLLYWLGTAILGVLCLELGHYLAGGWLDRKR
jgi:CrcB protein